MRNENTYHQDTLRDHTTTSDSPQVAGSEAFEGNQAAVGLEVSPSDTKSMVQTSVNTTAGSMARFNLWRREQKLVVGNSRYMIPRTEINLLTEVAINEPVHLPERPINAAGYDWMTVVLLVAVVLFASVRTSWGKYLNSLFHSTVNYATSVRMYQEKNSSVVQGTFQLDILFYLIFSVFLFQAVHFFRVDLPFRNFELYLYCLGVVLVFFMGKKILYKFSGALIEKKGETMEFLFNADNHKRVAGLVLIPVVTVIAFYPFNNFHPPLVFGIIIIGIIYFLLIFRGFEILVKKQFPIFYLFLYFCTLEFLPLVLLYKILVV